MWEHFKSTYRVYIKIVKKVVMVIPFAFWKSVILNEIFVCAVSLVTLSFIHPGKFRLL